MQLDGCQVSCHQAWYLAVVTYGSRTEVILKLLYSITSAQRHQGVVLGTGVDDGGGVVFVSIPSTLHRCEMREKV
jgi:hypothetical protein